ncbi:class I SAM-dependent methyltransferase [Pelagibacterales bacterium SAG-MED22]|nr:class I SAM-dependent methyltransferase [Pelagibacterales bacterium SAG-MED22]
MNLEDLISPIDKKKINTNNISYFSEIPDLYFDDKNSITSTQSEFYNDVKFPNYDDIDNFGTLLDKSSKSIFAKKLDEEIPYHSKVLEAGCGTGQLSIALSRYGRKIHSIDLSKGSLIEANNFIKKNEIKNVQVYRMNIFNLCFPKNYFDIIISNGVLHHTHNPKLAFNNLSECLKPNGIVVIGLYHKYGRIVQNIRQFLISIFGEKIKHIDRRFSENLSDKKKYAWFKDQYNNPHETKHSYNEVIDWFNENNIEFINSIPFNFEANDKLFSKKEKISKSEIFLKELFLIFNLRQIYEGGFFVMIGKKK